MKLRELQDDSFEAVISLFGSFSHAEDPARACAEITRVAKPGALILIMVYSRFSLRNIIAALGKMSLSPLLRTRPYYVRNATHGLINGAPAHFFTAGDLRKLFTRFENVRVFGLNAILETGLARAAFSRASAEFCSRLLLREQTLIASLPSAAHSLILIGRKPVSNDTTQALSIAA
jgi:SAM-dependent methyltransferase